MGYVPTRVTVDKQGQLESSYGSIVNSSQNSEHCWESTANYFGQLIAVRCTEDPLSGHKRVKIGFNCT
jgi:hypothetical protein